MTSLSLLSSCGSPDAAAHKQAVAKVAELKTKADADPMLTAWTGPWGGVPPWDKAKAEAFPPAFETGLALVTAEVDEIATNPEAPTFQNTIAALEDAGRHENRAETLFNVLTNNLNTDDVQKVDKEWSPKITAVNDSIVFNEKLFARIASVYEGREKAGLTDEQKRLAGLTYERYVRAGAKLNPDQKKRLGEINKELSVLYSDFANKVQADEKTWITLDKPADLAGLPDSLRAVYKAAAEENKVKALGAVVNTRSSVDPFLTSSKQRDLRERVWKSFKNRGDNGDANDTNQTIVKIVNLRAERAKLLSYPSHAHWRMSDTMAKTPQAAQDLMMRVWPAAVARVKEEVADMQAIAQKEGDAITIEPWDYLYYAEKVRKAKYDLDQNEVKPYLQLDKMREAMMWAAGQLYGFSFVKLKDVPVYQRDVTVYEVMRDGKHLGLWYFDPYARDGKQSGAWMNEYRTQEAFKDPMAPIVSNNSNFVKGKGAVLISWDDAVTMFHEFGHALHGLNSNVHYPTLAGTNTKRDFVEFPSQLNEHWLPTPEVLSKFALHYKTGKPIPAELVAKIQQAKHFNQGFTTVEYLASAIYDLKIHTAPTDKPIDPGEFEKRAMKEIGCPPEVVMRHRPTQFGHLFASDDYSAGYYVYIWADTLTADAAEAFVEAGSYYDKPTAKRLYDSIMSVGNSVPPEEAFRKFRGRDVDTNALMRNRGFPVTK